MTNSSSGKSPTGLSWSGEFTLLIATVLIVVLSGIAFNMWVPTTFAPWTLVKSLLGGLAAYVSIFFLSFVMPPSNILRRSGLVLGHVLLVVCAGVYMWGIRPSESPVAMQLCLPYWGMCVVGIWLVFWGVGAKFKDLFPKDQSSSGRGCG